ncbi:MAG TPA: glutathione S-transferase C-terminal domain-containing protein [Bradyrhizobium sp.]|jgi:glutathione S-transferase|nr:glutathione S-transferase C-terminal domain-containing protein [Bradyrhizobium sp.]
MIEPHDAVAPAAPGKAKVITFPPSLDCELSRFLLSHYGVPFEEQRHTVLFSFFHTLLHGATLYFPLLYGDGYRPLKNVREMIDFFDVRCPAGRNLLLGGRERDNVEADWTQFNATLGGATAAFAYFHFLPHRAIMIRPLSEGTPAYEADAVRWAYPLFAGFLRMALKLSAGRAQEALGQIRQVVQSVDARLADGRRYLVGDRFSLSDMAFANALAPLVLPPGYGGPLPGFAEMPSEVQSVVTEMQGHPAGQFALRIYRDHRGAAPRAAASPA